MELRFPKIREGECLSYEYFPTRMQCFIYRNWEVVEPARMARVLGTDEKTVLELAEQMGLPTPPVIRSAWLDKGYITIIRANWHLLPYKQLYTLLDWTPEKLAYMLAEDDYLDIKLGNYKPDAEPIRYAPLTAEETEKTAWIRKVTLEARGKLPEVTVDPFDFSALLEKTEKADLPDTMRFRDRFGYSYCALYGDVFSDRRLIDESYPESLLSAYEAMGVNGLWTQGVLYTLVPYPFEPELCEGYEKRLDSLRYLTEKLKKHGIRLFLYLNEPRAMNLPFFDRYPELKGVEERGLASLCVSRPEVQNYLRDGAKYLVEHVPELGGFLTITASENLTNCYSHNQYSECPRCRAARTGGEEFALVNRLLWEGASSVNPNFSMIAWTWGWPEHSLEDGIKNMPKEIDIMNVSEQFCKKKFGDTETDVLDYSISIEGPGEYALNVWRIARKYGHRVCAKIQANNSWEMSAVPCIPVFEKIYRHMVGLIEKADPDTLMFAWTLGGYPSPTMKFLTRFYDAGKPMPTIDELYANAFPKGDLAKLKEAFHLFSEAYDAFPFYIDVAYKAPQHYAPANLLFDKKTGFEATMVGNPFDDLESWRAIYPEETFLEQLRKLSDGWEAGMPILREAVRGFENDPTLAMILDCAEVCRNHFRSMYLQSIFVRDRDTDGKIRLDILKEEEQIALAEAAVMAHNPTIGYEASNHYFYTRAALLEKVLCCRYLTEKHHG